MCSIRYFIFFISLEALCMSLIIGYSYVGTSSRRAASHRVLPLLLKTHVDTVAVDRASGLGPSEYKLQSDSQLRALRFIHFVRKYERLLQKKSMTQPTHDHWMRVLQRSMVIERIIERSNLRLVYLSASRHQKMGLSEEELLKVGRRGLQTAIGKYYDCTVDCGSSSFSSFAYRVINHYVRKALSIQRSVPTPMPHNVVKLLTVVKTTRAHLQAVRGMPPTSEELRLEMGITPEQFDVVRRAIEFASRSSSSGSSGGDSRREATSTSAERVQHYDESTWEEVVSPYDELDRIDAVESTLEDRTRPSSSSSSVSYQSDAFHNILSILHTLPKEEAAAIYQRLGLAAFDDGLEGAVHRTHGDDKPTSSHSSSSSLTMLFQGQLFRMSAKEASALYQRGMHRLRRRVALSMLCSPRPSSSSAIAAIN